MVQKIEQLTGHIAHPLRAKIKESNTQAQIDEVVKDALLLHLEYGAPFWPYLDAITQHAHRRRNQLGLLPKERIPCGDDQDNENPSDLIEFEF